MMEGQEVTEENLVVLCFVYRRVELRSGTVARRAYDVPDRSSCGDPRLSTVCSNTGRRHGRCTY